MSDLSEFELIEIERALEGCDSLKELKDLLEARAKENPITRDRILLEMFGRDFRDLDTVLRGVPRLIVAVRQKQPARAEAGR